MPGPWTYATDVDVASRARAQLDEVAESVRVMEAAQRVVVSRLVALWPTSGWLAAGVRSATQWLQAHTGQSGVEARRLERIARLCSLDPDLCGAVVDGRFPLGWADLLGRAVTAERAPLLTADVVAAFLGLAESGVTDEQFGDVVRFWRERADEELRPRRVQRHSLVASPRLFGGGEVHAALAPVAFENVMAAVDAFTSDPDPADAPYRRTFSERRADGLDDLAVFGLTHGADGTCGVTRDDETELSEEVFDGTDPDGRDELDDVVDGAEPLDALRSQIRRRVDAEHRRSRRQVRPRSGSRVNVHIDLHTLSGERDLADLDDLVLRGDHWPLARSAAEQVLCDSTLVATLFRGRRVLDASIDAEQFSARQRRAIAARDRHCVFPGCTRPPRHCDAHHLHERADGGPTVVENGCLLCRFHHRLIHQYDWSLDRDDAGAWVATDPHGHQWTQRRPTHADAA